MLAFAQMSYLSPISALEVAKGIDASVSSATFFDIKDTQFYIVDMPVKKVVSFRGTSSASDAVDDARAYLVEFEGLNVKVHKGFYDQFKDAWPLLRDHLSRTPKNREIHFVGHSLGGALATLAGLLAVQAFGFQNVHVCTFGSPKVGDLNFARLFNATIENSARYVNRDDAVTYAPWFFFVHVNGEIKLGQKRADLRSIYFGRIKDHYLASYVTSINAQVEQAQELTKSTR